MFVSQYYSVVVSWLCFSLVIIINHFKVLQWLPSYKLDLHNGTKPSLKLYNFVYQKYTPTISRDILTTFQNVIGQIQTVQNFSQIKWHMKFQSRPHKEFGPVEISLWTGYRVMDEVSPIIFLFKRWSYWSEYRNHIFSLP